VQSSPIQFNDRIQDTISKPLSECSGDFIIKRSDGLFAYQLASVVDDQQLGISEIVRGYDLINSSLQQIHLQSLLNYPTPDYAHFPIIVNQLGIKLSKQSRTQPVSESHPAHTLYFILYLLKQNPPSELQDANLSTILQWAIEHWNPRQLLNCAEIVDTSENTV
jgi:glutamyl-Q tRNA(Asp) synthetase